MARSCCMNVVQHWACRKKKWRKYMWKLANLFFFICFPFESQNAISKTKHKKKLWPFMWNGSLFLRYHLKQILLCWNTHDQNQRIKHNLRKYLNLYNLCTVWCRFFLYITLSVSVHLFCLLFSYSFAPSSRQTPKKKKYV